MMGVSANQHKQSKANWEESGENNGSLKPTAAGDSNQLDELLRLFDCRRKCQAATRTRRRTDSMSVVALAGCRGDSLASAWRASSIARSSVMLNPSIRISLTACRTASCSSGVKSRICGSLTRDDTNVHSSLVQNPSPRGQSQHHNFGEVRGDRNLGTDSRAFAGAGRANC